MNDIIIRYIELPVAVHGYTLTDENNDYNIYINACIGIIGQENAKQHELTHIYQNHCFDNESALNNEMSVAQKNENKGE